MEYRKSAIFSLVIGAAAFEVWSAMRRKECRRQQLKNEEYNQILEKWLSERQNGHRIEEYFMKHGIYTIGIYGYGMLGRLLYKELRESPVSIKCIFDRNLRQGPENLPVMSPKEADSLKLEAIVVTPVCEYEKIKRELEMETSVHILSLEDILAEI